MSWLSTITNRFVPPLLIASSLYMLKGANESATIQAQTNPYNFSSITECVETGQHALNAQLSPNGQYMSYQVKCSDEIYPKYETHILNIETGETMIIKPEIEGESIQFANTSTKPYLSDSYISFLDNNLNQYLYNINNGQTIKIPKTESYSQTAGSISPNEKYLAYTEYYYEGGLRNSSVYLYEIETGEKHVVIEGMQASNRGALDSTSITVLNDGNVIIESPLNITNENDFQGFSSIYTINPFTGVTRRISRQSERARSAGVSPNGEHIAYISYTSEEQTLTSLNSQGEYQDHYTAQTVSVNAVLDNGIILFTSTERRLEPNVLGILEPIDYTYLHMYHGGVIGIGCNINPKYLQGDVVLSKDGFLIVFSGMYQPDGHESCMISDNSTFNIFSNVTVGIEPPVLTNVTYFPIVIKN